MVKCGSPQTEDATLLASVMLQLRGVALEGRLRTKNLTYVPIPFFRCIETHNI